MQARINMAEDGSEEKVNTASVSESTHPCRETAQSRSSVSGAAVETNEGRLEGKIAPSELFTKDSDLVARCIAGETIIVPVRAHVGDLESIYSLDEVGTLVWGLIDGQTRVRKIVEAVCSAYDVAPKEAEKDVCELLGELKAAGLIRPAGDAESDS